MGADFCSSTGSDAGVARSVVVAGMHPGRAGGPSSTSKRRFILASVGFVALAVLLFWAIGGLGELGLSGKGLVALTPGFLFTAGLAIGLKALLFFSDQSGRDDETNRAAER